MNLGCLIALMLEEEDPGRSVVAEERPPHVSISKKIPLEELFFK